MPQELLSQLIMRKIDEIRKRAGEVKLGVALHPNLEKRAIAEGTEDDLKRCGYHVDPFHYFQYLPVGQVVIINLDEFNKPIQLRTILPNPYASDRPPYFLDRE